MTTKADAKLIQYLTEAHAKEKELEISLQAHIGMASRETYKKRLKEHLKETKDHARMVERRLKSLDGGGISKTIADRLSQGIAAAKGPLHAARGSSEQEKELKNAKTEYSEEHEEIATYTAIEILAEEVGDSETAKLARQIRRDEERMANFLKRQIPVLTKAVARAEIPPGERSPKGRSRSSRSSAGGSKSRGGSGQKRSTKATGSSQRGGGSKRSTAGRRRG